MYRLVMRNHDFVALKNLIFGGKMGVAATVASNGLRPQDPTKKLELLGQPLSRKIV